MDACIRPVLDQAKPHSSVHGVSAHEAPPRWEERIFTLKGCGHALLNVLTPMCIQGEYGLSGLFFKRED